MSDVLNSTYNNLFVGAPRFSTSNSPGMGAGAVYSFSQFMLGTMSDICEETQNDTPPCPEEWADFIYMPEIDDGKSLFGHAIASTAKYIFISAPKSSKYSRFSGTIYVYEK